MIGSFILHVDGVDHLIELHWVDGQPAWMAESSEALKNYLNTVHGYRTNHPDSPGYPYWWEAIQALGPERLTVIKVPPRESTPPPGAVF